MTWEDKIKMYMESEGPDLWAKGAKMIHEDDSGDQTALEYAMAKVILTLTQEHPSHCTGGCTCGTHE